MLCASFSKKTFCRGSLPFLAHFGSFWLIIAILNALNTLKNGKNGSFFEIHHFFWKQNRFLEKKNLGFFFFLEFFFLALLGTARHCPALPAAMFGRHCQPPFLVRHCYLRRFNMREGGRTVGTGIVTQGQCVVELWRKKKQKWRRELNPVLTITEAPARRIGVYTENAITSSIWIFTGNVTPCFHLELIL